MVKINLEKMSKIHFVGIGGIGLSALARMMLTQGKQVSGSDSTDSALIHALQKEGAHIVIGHTANNVVDDIELLVYSTAVRENNPELRQAKALGIPTFTRSQFLGLVSRGYYTIAISGTHGKTTTTAMLTKVMLDAGLNPTALVGSLLTEQKTNFIAGKSKYFVVEACEYERSFLDLSPTMLIITNIEEDHLDYYKDLADIRSAFTELIAKISIGGVLIVRFQERTLLSKQGQTLLLAEVGSDPAFVPIKVVDYLQIPIGGLALRIPGKHNIQNAQAVLAAAEILGIPRAQAIASLNNYAGTWRRFEYRGRVSGNGASVYDDYAHHPTAIKATLQGAREIFGKQRRLFVIFQPHLYSRTKDFLQDFAKSFGDADEVIITDIYAAREKDEGTIHARDLVAKIQKLEEVGLPRVSGVSYIKNFSDIAAYLKKNSTPNDIIITMGAGDVGEVSELLVKK